MCPDVMPALVIRRRTAYGGDVRRHARSIAFLIAAAQLLLAVPAIATASVAAAPCAGMTESHNDSCPCCPDGVESMKDCLATCTLFAAVPVVVVVSQASISADPVEATFGHFLSTAAPPPLKPPPII